MRSVRIPAICESYRATSSSSTHKEDMKALPPWACHRRLRTVGFRTEPKGTGPIGGAWIHHSTSLGPRWRLAHSNLVPGGSGTGVATPTAPIEESTPFVASSQRRSWSSHGREVMISSPLPLDSNSLDSSQGMLGAFVRELGRPQSMQVRDAQSISKQPISGRWMWSPSISSKLTRSDETVVRFGTEGQELEQDEVHQPP